MIELRIDEIASIVAGRIDGADPSAAVTGSVEFDSRQVGPGGLFLALPGEHVDGHDYVGAALAQGAVAALVTRPVDGPCILVQDGLAALAALATAVADRLVATTIIGVTGSSGKTSTKDLLAHVLAQLGPTVAPPGSFNNELGHPYTVLRADTHTRFLVLENSARGIGHIAALTRIARPRVAAVLNVGSAHLGEFGSPEAIALAKGELVEALPAAADGGVAVLNADDPLVRAMADRTDARVVTVGTSPQADVRADGLTLDDLGRATFTLRTPQGSERVALRLVGAHQVGNALAAAAIALECGMALTAVAAALSAAEANSHWRMQLCETRDGVVVINDAYNANPESMRAALQTLAMIAARRAERGARAFAVLGPMAELGEAAPAEHEQLGRFAASLGLSRVISVGDLARPIAAAAVASPSWHGRATECADVPHALGVLRAEARAGDVVLIKASRAARLERLALAMTEDARDAEPDYAAAASGDDGAGDGVQ